ncbi:MAG: helix-turn-helix domain-containing protein [Phycisphaerae bacterium]|nr:helix-turn-helix domain-containing protein [Phycisphaerae bacterium]
MFDLLSLTVGANPNASQAPPPLLGPAELARRLRLSPRTIRRWRALNKLPPPSLAIGRVLRWTELTFAAWLEGQGTRRRRKPGRGGHKRKTRTYSRSLKHGNKST